MPAWGCLGPAWGCIVPALLSVAATFFFSVPVFPGFVLLSAGFVLLSEKEKKICRFSGSPLRALKHAHLSFLKKMLQLPSTSAGS